MGTRREKKRGNKENVIIEDERKEEAKAVKREREKKM